MVRPVLFLATSPREPAVAAALDAGRVGLIAQPGSNPTRAGWTWAADNGCFGGRWDPDRWVRWLDAQPREHCLFAVVPDVVADAAATRARFDRWAPLVAQLGYPVAYALQDGETVDAVPWAALDAVFVGGSTVWKLSEVAHALAVAARARGLWVHVGRVNSRRRFRAWSADADSCDGSLLAYGPATNLGRVLTWTADADTTPQLWYGR
jgi:hypothetical protein